MSKNVNVKFLTKILPGMVGGAPGKVAFVLGNGVRVELELAKLNADMKEQLILHGISQKVGDSASGFSKARDFHGAFGAMQGVVDTLYAGAWSSRSGGGTSDLVQALAELQGLEEADVQAAVDAMDEEQLAEVRKHPAVKAKVAELVQERAKAAAERADVEDVGSMLSRFGLKG